MRRLALAAGAIVLAALPAAGSSAFSSTEDGFSVLFPSPPHVEAQSVDIAEARRASIRMYRVDEAKTGWLVSATDVAEAPLDAARTLSATRNAVVRGSGGTLTIERPLKIGRFDGLEMRIERTDGTLIRARICVTPRRIFEVIVATTEEAHRLAQIERFLDSFEPE